MHPAKFPADQNFTDLETVGGNLIMYFGLTIESPDFNYSYLGGPVETSPTIPTSVVRSSGVWSPGNGQVGISRLV